MAETEKRENPMDMILKLSKVFDRYLRIEMKKIGMKSSYRHMLCPLAVQDGVTQLDLVKISGLKAPTVSTTLRSMEEEGLVSRSTDKDDARATRVFITPKGRDIYEKVRNSSQSISEIMISGLSEAEIDSSMTILKKIEENVKANDALFGVVSD